MKVLILYRPRSEAASNVEGFIRDFKMRHDTNRLEVLDVDSQDGSAKTSLYGIMNYPAILVLRDDGSVVHSWEGEPLPLMDDIAYYTFEG